MATSIIKRDKSPVKTEVTFTLDAANHCFSCTPSIPAGKNIYQAVVCPFGMNDETYKIRNNANVFRNGSSSFIVYFPSDVTITKGTTLTTYVIWF